MQEYFPRVIDTLLNERLETKGAVLVQCPK